MSLIELKIDPEVLARAVRVLEDIRDLLRIYIAPTPLPVAPSKPAGPEDLIEFDPEEEWQREQEEEVRGKKK